SAAAMIISEKTTRPTSFFPANFTGGRWEYRYSTMEIYGGSEQQKHSMNSGRENERSTLGKGNRNRGPMSAMCLRIRRVDRVLRRFNGALQLLIFRLFLRLFLVG